MPYIYCERCASGSYSNVLSCPSCKARVRPARTHGMGRRAWGRSRQVLEDVEDEVRETLYGWHSGCVELSGAERA
jgi:hypothetical protein